MKRRSVLQAAVAIPLAGLAPLAWSRGPGNTTMPMAFGFGGSKKMLYDVRQRPQAVYFKGKVFIGYKGGGTRAADNQGSVAQTHAMLLSYDPVSRQFSESLMFGKTTGDHHDSPVVAQ